MRKDVQFTEARSQVFGKKITINKEIIGFFCYMRTNNPKEFKIDKLYVHCNHHRKRYGTVLVEEAIKIRQDNNLDSFALAINKQNPAEIGVYHQYSFTITLNSAVDIGGRFILNDY